MDPATGIVYLIGIGSGRAGHLSVEARALLASAESVVHDEGVPTRILALAPTDAVVHRIAGRGAPALEEEHRLLARLVRQGRRVVRLFPGDPLHGGAAGEVAIFLAAEGHPFEVVPGIDVLGLVAAECGIPLLHPGVADSMLVVRGPLRRPEAAPAEAPPARRPGVSVQRRRKEPGHATHEPQLRSGLRMKLSPEGSWISRPGEPRDAEHDDPAGIDIDWGALCRTADTLVLQRMGHQLDLVGAGLLSGGRPPSEPAAILVPLSAGRWEGRVLTVAELASQPPETPSALIVVGDAVALREVILPARRRPLDGLVVAFAGGDPGAEGDTLARAGARVVGYDILCSQPVGGIVEELALLADDLRGATHLLATTEDAARQFFAGLREAGLDARVLPESCRLAAAGAGAAAVLAQFGFRCGTVPAQPSAHDLVRAWGEDLSGARVMLICEAPGEPAIVAQLRPHGPRIAEVPLCTAAPNNRELARLGEDLQAGAIDLLAFPSAAAVRTFAANWPPDAVRRLAARARIASLSERVTEQLLQLSLTPAIEADDAASLVAALADQADGGSPSASR